MRAKPGGNQKRITRAVLYACVAVVFVVVWLVVELGADRDEMLDFLGASLLFVALPVALGVAAGVLIIAGKALRKWRAKRRQ